MHLTPIPPRSRRCYKNEEDFYPGGEYYSLLESIKEGYKRSDFCPNCWQSESSSGKIFWKSRIPEKEPSSQRYPEALSFLKTLIQTDQESSQAFILALFLARNRLLRYLKEVQENDEIMLLYEVLETEEILCIKKVELSAIQAEEVRKALSSVCS
jgi:hypothetical protein